MRQGKRSRESCENHKGYESHKNYGRDRKSTRLNSSHLVISYAVFCLKKKKFINHRRAHFPRSLTAEAPSELKPSRFTPLCPGHVSSTQIPLGGSSAATWRQTHVPDL